MIGNKSISQLFTSANARSIQEWQFVLRSSLVFFWRADIFG